MPNHPYGDEDNPFEKPEVGGAGCEPLPPLRKAPQTPAEGSECDPVQDRGDDAEASPDAPPDGAQDDALRADPACGRNTGCGRATPSDAALSPRDCRIVFELRRKGCLAEALSLARRLARQFPEDVWVARSLFYCLYDCWKQAPAEERAAWARELSALPEIPDDEIAARLRANVGNPMASLFADARRLREQGRLGEALRLLLNAWKSNRGHPRLEKALGWTLYLDLKELRKDGQLTAGYLQDSLLTYLSLETVEDERLHELMARLAVAEAREGRLPRFCAFLKRWRPEVRLKPRHFAPEQTQKGAYPSFAERILEAMSETIREEPSGEVLAWAAAFARSCAERLGDSAWGHHHAARVLLAAGEGEAARPWLAAVVRKRPHEGWAWAALAATFAPCSQERLKLLARASLCPGRDEALQIGVYVSYAEELARAGHRPEALALLHRVLEVRRNRGWPTKSIELALERPEWEGVPPGEPGPLSRRLAEGAEELVEKAPL